MFALCPWWETATLTNKVRTGSGTCWKVMEIENTIFKDLGCFGKEMIFYKGYGKVLDFCLEKL